jgi:hypothetical protein
MYEACRERWRFKIFFPPFSVALALYLSFIAAAFLESTGTHFVIACEMRQEPESIAPTLSLSLAHFFRHFIARVAMYVRNVRTWLCKHFALLARVDLLCRSILEPTSGAEMMNIYMQTVYLYLDFLSLSPLTSAYL